MDYASEQEMELEALDAIFPDDLEEFDGNLPDGWTRHGKTYSIAINPSAEVEAAGAGAAAAAQAAVPEAAHTVPVACLCSNLPCN